MNYKCVKEMYISIVDEDCSFVPNKYGYVPIGSEWYIDNANNLLGGDVHLECIGGCDDCGWIEITDEDLEENFIAVGDEQ